MAQSPRDRRSSRPAFNVPTQVKLGRTHPLAPDGAEPPMRLVGDAADPADAEVTGQPDTTGPDATAPDATPTSEPPAVETPVEDAAPFADPPAADAATADADKPEPPTTASVGGRQGSDAAQEPLDTSVAIPAEPPRRRRAARARQPQPPAASVAVEAAAEEGKVVEALVALGTRVPKSMLKRLKIAAVSKDMTVQEAVTEAVGKWLADTDN